MTPLNKKTEEKKKKTAADDGVASSSKNTTSPFHLSSRVGVSNGNPPLLLSLANQYLPY